LFAQEAQMRKTRSIPLWEQLADAIKALGIEVVEEGAASLTLISAFSSKERSDPRSSSVVFAILIRIFTIREHNRSLGRSSREP